MFFRNKLVWCIIYLFISDLCIYLVLIEMFRNVLRVYVFYFEIMIYLCESILIKY